MTQKKIWLSPPHMGTAERGFVGDAFETNWIAPLGPNVDGFEKDLSAFTGVPHAAVLSSGTAALHLALLMLGVKKNDPVLCQSFTFSASANPIVYLGAEPVFIDSEKDTWNMDPDALESAIRKYMARGKKPVAIIPVHLYGMPAAMNEIMGIGERYGIPVIEDAAEALGSVYNGMPCGSFGEMSVLSFNGNKIITTSGGGALLSHRKVWIEKARFLSTQARDPAPHYEHSQIGYNYRMSNVLAGIGRGQMQVLTDRVESRRANFSFYTNALSQLPGISFQPEPESAHSNRWLTCILVDPEKSGGITREQIRVHLAEKNIETRPLWKPMHLQPVFKSAVFEGSGLSDKLFEQGLCLPSGSSLTEDDLSSVESAIKELFR